jgi:hypothetical protein
MASYNAIDSGYPYRCRGTVQQTDDGLLYLPPALGGSQAGGTPQSRVTLRLEGLGLGWSSLHNRSGGAAVVGIGVRLPNRLWIAGQFTAGGGGTFTDDTTDAQDAGTSDFALETNIANEGYVVACREKFNTVSINVGTASTGGTPPVRAVSYSNADGSGWTTMSNLFVQDGAAANYATGENIVAFAPPSDWGKTQTGGLNSIPEGYYAIRVLSTTAPGGAVGLATAMEVLRLYLLEEAVADNGRGAELTPAMGEIRMPFGTGVAALFSAASPGNRVAAGVRMLT